MQQMTTDLKPNCETTAVFKCNTCQDKGGWIELRDTDNTHLRPLKRDGQLVYRVENGRKVQEYERVPLKAEHWVACSCQKQRQAESLMKSSSITAEFAKLTFSNFTKEFSPHAARLYDCAFSYVTKFRDIRAERCNSVALLGQPGIGKTHLLSAVANGLMQKWLVPVHYFPFVEGMEDLKSSFNDGEVALAVKMERLKTVDVLFIDDLFKPASKVVNGERVSVPRATEWQIDRMFEIVNYRYLNNKPMLISSELNFAEMLKVDEALASRMFEMCASHTVAIEKDSMLNYRMRQINGV